MRLLRSACLAALAGSLVAACLFPSLDGLTDADASSGDVFSGEIFSADGSTLDCNTPGLVAYWALDEGAGTIANDCKDSAPGTLVGPVTWEQDSPNDAGASLHFNGGGGVVQFLTNAASLDVAAPFTISLWMKSDPPLPNASAVQDLVVRYSPGAWGIGTDNASYYFTIFSQDASTIVTGTPTYTTNVWRHVAGVLDSSFAASIYIDGMLVTSQPAADIATVSTPLLFGGNNVGATPYSGHLARVALFARALSATEIAQLAAP